ncbi:crotonase/enoyl-CoA hydratase family protein [Tersicoccus sp. Bi-70]|uniref:crotonase/enoyl-CoA hydratase family protein n=1 Tax=Tersicoccus sp. Bi-70 TaxID=1897634 RepID=UPI00097856DC|nr:crotonase/enoyl-CoA hydratase family protein [Tersicoccus sp. Bi-70]OMH34208.1 enoyl-CoA hydratase [Tersicoccus sp. Bi-70]
MNSTDVNPTDTTDDRPLLVTEHGAVMVMTINRPHARNAIDLGLATALAEATTELDARPDLRVGVLTGSAGVFSAGMDLKAFAAGQTPTVPGRGFGGLVEAEVATPLIAAIEGYALGGGLELALACDLVVTARDARLGLPEVTRGLVAGAGGVFRLPRRIPRALALQMMLTGEPIDGARAAELGLAVEATEPGQSLEAALDLAERIATSAPLALAAVTRILRETEGLSDAEAFAVQRPIIASLKDSADAAEGARAFAEKRPPQWTGR